MCAREGWGGGGGGGGVVRLFIFLFYFYFPVEYIIGHLGLLLCLAKQNGGGFTGSI